MAESLEMILSRFASISLEEMDAIRLMNRVDTKFVTDRAHLDDVLVKALDAGYRVLEADGGRLCGYDTLYYDTPGRDMYLAHHNRRLSRQKVRTRTYLGSGATFVEIKSKDNHGRTHKKRVALPRAAFSNACSDAQALEFLRSRCRFAPESLSPALSTAFKRITLVNPQETERLTIDTSLTFTDRRGGGQLDLGDGVIIELKQDSLASSPMLGILLDERIHPLRISKYCIGSALTNPTLKQNNFKLKTILLGKTLNRRFI